MEGYRVKEYGMPVKRYCQALDLKNNPELIAEYRKIHSREKAWRKFGRESVQWGYWKWKSIS